MKVNLVNPRLNCQKQCKVGFSWTVLFFESWVPFLRGDWKWAVIMFVISRISDQHGEIGTWNFYFNQNTRSFITFNAFGIFSLWMAFCYNRIYINGLLRSGYVPMDEEDQRVLAERGFFNSRFQGFYWSWIEGIAAIATLAFWIRLEENDFSVVLILGTVSLLVFCLYKYVSLGSFLSEESFFDETLILENHSFFKRMTQALVAITTGDFKEVTRQDLKDLRRVLLAFIILLMMLTLIPIVVTTLSS